ncbi:CHAT domain protein [Variovorax sp. SRS16]|uniref:CHAT domain-containing protein n=1 Tax=Variovorax sp. SRS16 TaxID=282217 RepID=UPI00131885B2|nr:CHAT domain-containing protein [Variovorax sp. SRS16]VTU21175.1 CHAT domain protein [Variovorax sp. SRS16]
MPPETRPAEMNAFDLLIRSHLDEIATVQQGARGAGAGDGFDPDQYAAADVLSVHFSDGSVLHTSPAEFAARHASAASLAAVVEARGRGADGPAPARAEHRPRVVLPFELRRPAEATRSGGAGPAATPVEMYRIARLTPPTLLDRLYDTGAIATDVIDRWLGARPMHAGAWVAAGLCATYEDAVLDAGVGRAGGCLLEWSSTECDWRPRELSQAAPRGRILLFLHGTASSTRGSFSRLWMPDAKADSAERKTAAPDFLALCSRYDSLLAWEHRSLTRSPIDNAIELLEALDAMPEAGTIDLVSHSRGGMIGELLCLAGAGSITTTQWTQLEALFKRAYEGGHPDGTPADGSRVERLFALLAKGARFRIGTFVRVACPARGTLLADRRTDLYLSLMLRAIGLAFGTNGVPMYERFNGFVRSLVAARGDARSIPGLEAMIPGSPLTLALNGCTLVLPERLRVIAGDSDGLGWGGLTTMLGDLFYGLHDHDFVVHTHSMFGGFERADARSLRVADKSVTHFGYFKADALSRRPLMGVLAGQDDGWLSLAEDERRTRGLLQALTADPRSRWPRQRWLAAIGQMPARPVLVVLPGIMGSELSLDGQPGELVWLSPSAALKGELAKLEWLTQPAQALGASGLVAIAYERLLERASAQFNVVTFPYDWRAPIMDSGRALAGLLRDIRQLAPASPIHLIAHSMGGLVARAALFQDSPALWSELKQRGSRLLMLGTPNAGAYAPVMLLMQQHRLGQWLAMAARKVTPEDLAGWGGRFEGLMDMLPHEADPTFGDWFVPATWDRLLREDRRAHAPDPDTLERAGRFRAAMQGSFADLKKDPNVLYVAGQGDTPVALVKVEPQAWAGFGEIAQTDTAGIAFGYRREGDGTVGWNSTLDGQRTWYAACGHGDLADHVSAFEAYFELLHTGRTAALPQQRPVSRAAPDAASDAPPAPMLRPAEETLPSLPADPMAFLLGMRSQAPAATAPQPIEVRVVHGSLDYARFPLIVGHYLNERLIGAGKRVDEKLGGMLQRMLDLHLFEGASRTGIYLRPRTEDGKPPSYPGTLVLGLGTVGELTPASLADTVTRGLLRFAFEHVHVDPFVDRHDPVQLRLSTLLIGTHVHAISARDSLTGVLNGIWRAAQLLARDAPIGRPVCLAEVEIVEIIESVALDAAYELRDLLRRPEWRQRLTWRKQVLEIRDGGLSGYRPRYSNTVWQRLVVQKQEGLAGLHYSLIAERARVESTRTFSDIGSLAPYIARVSNEEALRSASEGSGTDLGRVLFQLLLPQDLKSRIANFENTILVLDDEAASLPWELLRPPARDAGRVEEAFPLGVQAGLIRQRSTEDFRRLPNISDGWDALVVGATSTEGWKNAQGQPLAYAPLAGALREAELVVDALTGDDRPWRIKPLIGPLVTFEQVRTELLARPCRLLHLCGHGVVDQWVANETVRGGERRPVTKTGMVLSHQQILTAADVDQMDPAPEFVFINCCYSARDSAADAASAEGRRNYPVLAASLALQFIRMGSKAVVAAGWQIEDDAGQAFATSLYQSLLDGSTFGEAVHRARSHVWDSSSQRGNTWGAYQCYGDAEWQLAKSEARAGAAVRREGSSRLRGIESCMSPRELAQRVMQAVALAGDKPQAELKWQLSELERSLADDPDRKGWLNASVVHTAFGEAYRELGAHRDALRWFQSAARIAYSKLQLRQIELMANSLSRIEQGDGAPDPHNTSAALLKWLDGLADESTRWPLPADVPDEQAVNESAASEHLCLLGGDKLRQAAKDGAQRTALLDQAADCFRRGYENKCGKPRDSADRRAFALSNALLAGALADLSRGDTAPDAQLHRALQEAVSDLIAEIDAESLSTRFWHYTNTLELLTASNLRTAVDGGATKTDELDRARRLLQGAMERWPSPAERESLEHRFQLMKQVLAAAERSAREPELAKLARWADDALACIAKPRAERL